MKRLLIIALVILGSCDDTYDFLKGLPAPTLYFDNNKELKNLSDSLKISVKTGKKSYSFVLNEDDSTNTLENINYTIDGGRGTLSSNNATLNGSLGSLAQSGDPIPLTFIPSVVGAYTISFSGQNKVGNNSKAAKLNLTVFNNLPPAAIFSATESTVNGNYAYFMDATKSYDKDARFGGLVKDYQYTVTSDVYGKEVILNNEATTLIVFPGPGTYNVSLIVFDNDGAPSIAYSLPTPIVIN